MGAVANILSGATYAALKGSSHDLWADRGGDPPSFDGVVGRFSRPVFLEQPEPLRSYIRVLGIRDGRMRVSGFAISNRPRIEPWAYTFFGGRRQIYLRFTTSKKRHGKRMQYEVWEAFDAPAGPGPCA